MQLLNTILIPRWTYRTLFLPNDSMFKAMDAMCLRFMLMAEGMELNNIDIHKLYNVLHITSPHRLGGMGLHQLFQAHKAHFITMVQNTLRSHPGSTGCDLSKELPPRAVPIRNYLAILTQLGARTALHVVIPPRPAGGPNLTDGESSNDGSFCQPVKNKWGMPSTHATTLPHTGAMKTLRRAQCPWDTTVSPSQAYRATQTSNRQPKCPYTPTAAFKQLRSPA